MFPKPRRPGLDEPLAEKSVALLQPACTETLPAVASTISGIIQATEVAAQKVLDQADLILADRNRLCEALVKLNPFIAKADPAARQACIAAIEAVQGLSPRIDALVGAMEFQDLTAQHLRAAIDAVESLRAGILELLRFLEVPVATDPPPVKITTKIGTPAASSPWRQALADDLLSQRGQPAVSTRTP